MRTRPSLPSSIPTEETVQEKLLRDVFQQQVEKNVEVEQAWMQVAQRLPVLHRQPKPAGKFQILPRFSREQPRKARLRRLPMLATLVLIVVFLMGAGVAAGITSPTWRILVQRFLAAMSQHIPVSQFQEIKQTRISNGVAVTVETAYADTGRTIIGFEIQLSPELMREGYSASVMTGFDFVINNQKESLETQAGMCALNDEKAHQALCLWSLSPAQVSDTTNKLDITWNITAITLLKPVPGEPGLRNSGVFHGHWNFHFTLLFHHQNRDPGIPTVTTS